MKEEEAKAFEEAENKRRKEQEDFIESKAVHDKAVLDRTKSQKVSSPMEINPISEHEEYSEEKAESPTSATFLRPPSLLISPNESPPSKVQSSDQSPENKVRMSSIYLYCF